MPEQGVPTGAVFLSYASQDAPAAERICEALRAAGVEVWLDKSELRGGDAWDALIKKRIHECALFIPIISAHTNARSEGYFRREWKQAIRRLQDMADDVAFLVPVVIDETREAESRVPEEFLSAQWTWLPGGETPPEFAQRVGHLLGADSRLVHSSQSAADSKIEPRVLVGFARERRLPPVRPVGLAVIGLLVLGAVAFWYFQGARNVPAAKLVSAATSPEAPISPDDKSIAVLPFVDMSEKKDQEYFADGLAAELLDQLAKTPGLHVVARTSSFSFKGKSDDIPTIATKLKVANILEGSVRKSGNQFRINTELVRASDGEHLWSESYDREMKDIFKIQDEIARAVVSALKLKLSPTVVASSSRTANTDAYVQYMLGQEYFYHGSVESLRRSIVAYRRAIALDPNYAAAYAGLALADDYLSADTGDSTGPRRALATAERAIELAPDQPLGYSARGDLRSFAWDWTGAQTDYAKALKLDPNNPIVLKRYSRLLIVLGQIPEAVSIAREVTELDPLSADTWMRLSLALIMGGNMQVAREANGQALALDPTSWNALNNLGQIELFDHRPSEALAAYKRIEVDGPTTLAMRLTGIAMAECSLGHNRESQLVLNEAIAKTARVMAYQIAQAYAWCGEKEEAFDWLDRAYRQHDDSLKDVKVDRILASLFGDPRYKAMLRKMNLPE